jgi:hypothetical protein
MIIGYHTDKPIDYTSMLRERSLGVFEGKSEKEVKQLCIKKGIREFKPEGGESLDDLLMRVDELLGEIIIKYCKKDYREENVYDIKSLNKPKTATLFKKKDNSGSKTNHLLNLQRKSNVDLLFEFKREEKYLKYEFEELIDNFDFKKITKVYTGLDTDLNIPRVLLITHRVYIQELLNLIRKHKGITNFQNYSDSEFTGLYIFRVYCPQCVGICYSKNEKCKLDYDIILYNDTEHFG